jgi:hypothetical protein
MAILTYPATPQFLEIPDGSLTTFTVETPFVLDTLIIAQGSLIWTDFSYTDTSTIEFGTAPLAPAIAGDLILLSGWFGDGTAGGPWTVAQWQIEYGVSSVEASVIAAALARATTTVQAYILAEVYTDAVSPAPSDPLRAMIIKYAIGNLVRVYLAQTGNLAGGSLTKYMESYAGVKKYEEEYSSTQDATLVLTEASILVQLLQWKRPSTFQACEGWGTGRFVSAPLVVTGESS